jgi:hypothetical protein
VKFGYSAELWTAANGWAVSAAMFTAGEAHVDTQEGSATILNMWLKKIEDYNLKDVKNYTMDEATMKWSSIFNMREESQGRGQQYDTGVL